ncbi:assembly of actin patch protein [Rhodotorula toruloides]|uniref:BY PROTMAP: gi/472582264/gb/EMS19960.1/ SH3 domain protein [Rhodosporidium toruloides NP11] gi/647399630/emb/CDR44528.1/ RHTO0S09e05622g1_1 [Rhodosporidium toruloides] n=1 Tax=Rhodotorula toruloides TaxID=5286 RepID=A0A0K3CMR4_RHOTO|nr:hypothetical protein AAT19DRAFT_9815 [Rhodotorula toruloides]
MPPTYPYRATALMKYKSAPGGPAFSFGAGEELRVLAAADEEGDWLEGQNGKGEKGVFPSSFVKELEEEEEERGDSASVEAVGTAQKDEAEQKARETVEATPKDDTNVVEGSESTPADEPALAAESTSPPASTKADAPPAETITSPTVADVTPASTTTTEAPAKSASPPPPAKKPNALASRIAAFNAAAQQQAPPPVAPKPKPRQWARPAAPAAAPPPPAAAPSSDAPAPAPAPAAAPSSDSAPAAPSTDETQTQAQRDFSAEDAQESISRGGGSLRDRIKALQGGLKMEQPPAPGRAPPKPWRKPSAEPDAAEETKEEGEMTQQDEAEILQDAVVKDERPREDETNAQSPGAEVPGFDPAEGDSPFVPSSVAGDDEQEAESKDTTEPASSDAVKQESIAASIAAPAAVEEKEEDSTVSSVAVPVEPEEVKPVQEDSAAANDEDDEESKRANLAARMANLGGQRMGLPMPALPKRAAGPRARKAKAAVSPAAVEVEEKALGEKDKPAEEAATTDEPVGPAGTDDAEASVVQPPQEEQEEQKGDVLASMGGASALLARDDQDEDESAKAPVDDDDFDSPAPPAPPQRSVPPPAEESEPAVEADQPSTRASPPPPLSSRPPLPPSFARKDAEDDDLPESGAAPRSPPPPSRPLDPPAFSSGAETITDEPRPTAHEPEHDQADDTPMSPPPLPKGRPPVPPTFVRQATEQPAAAEQDKDEEEPASKNSEEPQHPPLPTHPAPLGEQRVTTAAEDAFIAQMPEIVTPPEEAADESTAAPSLNAPTTETIAQGRIEDGHEPADMGQPAWGKVEGTETPAVELSPPALAPKMLAKEETNKAPVEQKQDEEDEEEEEEDPEIARRRALAARMAKLGGRGPLMGGPMLGFGGVPPKKPAKKKPTSELAEQGDLNAAGGPKPDEPTQRDEEESAPAPPPRRPGGIPAGGFALPGIAPLRLPPQHEPEEQPSQTEEESEPLPTSGKTLAEKSAAATDQAFARTDEEREKMDDAGVAPKDEEGVREEQVVEREEVPPPLPPSRPSTLPPRRSVPTPAAEEHDDDAEDEPEQPDVLSQSRQVEEPEVYGEEPLAHEDEDEMPPPPPPPRPAGGHQSSLPLAPPMPPTRAIPSSPPTHPAPNPTFFQQDDSELARTATQSSRKSSINPPRSSLDVPFEPLRAASTSSSQAQYPQASKPNLDALLQWSASLGAQVFAAAHTKMSDKQARGLSDADLINFCFSRATDPLPPAGGRYGVKIYEATVEQGKKVPLVREEDEPRAGDVVTIAAKFKHNLSSKTVGSLESPHVVIVAGWDAKKGKLKVVEVEGKNGTVDEGSYRIDEMRAGQVVVYRVAPKDFFE